ncbi:hypothetical protein BJV77DRAFT_965975 [Russula vinacea]|nr:hypothetical protein BJV77DRAFT_965975 [Russula vinacea]
MDLSGSGSGSGCSAAPALASMVLMSELWRLLPGTSHCARTGSTDDGGGAAVWEAHGVVHRRRRMSQTQSYGSWLFSGVECTDVTIAQVASAFEDFDDVGGILGTGLIDLTICSCTYKSSGPSVHRPSLIKSLRGKTCLSILQVHNHSIVKNGKLTFGCIGSTKFTGLLPYVSRLRQHDIVDTGTTLILIATDAFERCCGATGAVLDPATQLLRITQHNMSTSTALLHRQ